MVMREQQRPPYRIRTAEAFDLSVVRQISADAYIPAYMPILGYIPLPAGVDESSPDCQKLGNVRLRAWIVARTVSRPYWVVDSSLNIDDQESRIRWQDHLGTPLRLVKPEDIPQQAASRAKSTRLMAIPVVFLCAGDPVSDGLGPQPTGAPAVT